MCLERARLAKKVECFGMLYKMLLTNAINAIEYKML
jgi:hypothetical protein